MAKPADTDMTTSVTRTFIPGLLVGSPRRAAWCKPPPPGSPRGPPGGGGGGKPPPAFNPPPGRGGGGRHLLGRTPPPAPAVRLGPVGHVHVHPPHALTDGQQPAPPDRLERRLELGA